MRYFIKGGVWKNSEDEILKAAVMKYGKNQWARISSLLVRKSAKQCKARWYEWLDPSIKKTDWTREEEEKLLHLAKVMPNQWRTIAPIIGRTASQCLEHYERLIDEAQRELEGGAEGSTEDLRKLRPGEIDPTPETRPARPDPVDMDEDEKEMLSEARARLANTKGKKAKRKAREKQLEEAKRLAMLQKKRELRAAGFRVGTRIRIKGFNYVEEIPFEKKPPPGFFDVVEEEKESEKIAKELKTREVGQLIEKYEGKRRIDQEAAARKAEAKRRRLFEEQNLPETLKNKYEKEREQILKSFQRTALKLPEPQINDEELQMLRKSSLATEEYQQYGRVGERSVTENLLADYSKTPTPQHYSKAWSTPSTASQSVSQTPVLETWNETKRREARDLLHMSTSQTPLEGGENLPLSNVNFSQGSTPKQRSVQTPNPLLTPSKVSPSPFSSISASPRYSYVSSQDGGYSGSRAKSSNMEEKARMKLLRKKLQEGLQLLPPPQNEYKLTVSGELEEEEVESNDSSRLEDARDEMEKKKREEERKKEEEKKLWPTAEQLGLPCASEGKRWSSEEENLDVVDMLIIHEVNYLLQQSHLMHEMKEKGSTFDAMQSIHEADPMSAIPKEYFHDALKQIDEEKSKNPNLIKEYESCCDTDNPYLGVFSEDDGSLQSFLKESEATPDIVIGSKRHELEHLISAQNNVKANMEQLRKYIDIHHGGYWKRLESLNQELNEHINEIEELNVLKHCYELAEKRETVAMQQRLSSKERLTNELKQRELELQKQYGELLIERDRLLSRKL